MEIGNKELDTTVDTYINESLFSEDQRDKANLFAIINNKLEKADYHKTSLEGSKIAMSKNTSIAFAEIVIYILCIIGLSFVVIPLVRQSGSFGYLALFIVVCAIFRLAIGTYKATIKYTIHKFGSHEVYARAHHIYSAKYCLEYIDKTLADLSIKKLRLLDIQHKLKAHPELDETPFYEEVENMDVEPLTVHEYMDKKYETAYI